MVRPFGDELAVDAAAVVVIVVTAVQMLAFSKVFGARARSSAGAVAPSLSNETGGRQ